MRPFVYPDDEGRVAGFWGLSTVPTHHRLRVTGRTLWAFCAQDSLFLPELLGETAQIESRDPESGELVRLRISPDRVEAVEPDEVWVSMIQPDTMDLSSITRIVATGCHFVFFFASRASGERWLATHPGKVLLSLDEAFAWAKRQNASLFGSELARRAQARRPL